VTPPWLPAFVRAARNNMALDLAAVRDPAAWWLSEVPAYRFDPTLPAVSLLEARARGWGACQDAAAFVVAWAAQHRVPCVVCYDRHPDVPAYAHVRAHLHLRGGWSNVEPYPFATLPGAQQCLATATAADLLSPSWASAFR